MPLIIPANSITGGYEIDNSLRFDRASDDKLTKSPATTTNKGLWTASFWLKRSGLSETTYLFNAGSASAGGTFTGIVLNTSDVIIMYWNASAGAVVGSNELRDTSAWYHIVLTADNSNMVLYINGVQTGSRSAGTNSAINNSSNTLGIGGYGQGTNANNLNGYMSEIYFIDGQALTPTNFGEFDEDTGIWIPKKYTGTYGTNGFYLDFENSGSLGADQSGNGNNFTVNNLTSDDQMLDTPTNNWSTLNPLIKTTADPQLTQGNLSYDPSSAYGAVYSSFGVNTGKWYWEIYANSGGARIWNGIQIHIDGLNYIQNGQDLEGCVAIGNNNNDLRIDGSTVSGSANWTTGDIVGFALDADAGTLDWTINGVSQTQVDFTSSTAWGYNHFITSFSTTNVIRNTYNFGQDSSFAGQVTRQNNQDSNGQGDFYYSPPSNYYALCTNNLAEFG
jgi:hypothetical protein